MWNNKMKRISSTYTPEVQLREKVLVFNARYSTYFVLTAHIVEKSYRLKTDLLSVEALLASLPAITDFSKTFHRVQI
jgi:hypothetical protein